MSSLDLTGELGRTFPGFGRIPPRSLPPPALALWALCLNLVPPGAAAPGRLLPPTFPRGPHAATVTPFSTMTSLCDSKRSSFVTEHSCTSQLSYASQVEGRKTIGSSSRDCQMGQDRAVRSPSTFGLAAGPSTAPPSPRVSRKCRPKVQHTFAPSMTWRQFVVAWEVVSMVVSKETGAAPGVGKPDRSVTHHLAATFQSVASRPLRSPRR